jgi:uncharacterized protein (DUF58 family)
MKSTFSLRWLLASIIFFGLTGWIITGQTLYSRIAYLGIFLSLIMGIWALFSSHGILLNRQARTLRANMGDVFEEHFEVKNNSWIACQWLEILNLSNLPLAGGSRLLTGIGSHQRRFYTARTLLYRRGAFLLGPTKFTTGDPFGLFNISKLISEKDTLVVFPMTVTIKIFPPPPGLLPGGKAIRIRTTDVTPHASGIRDYVPGDPMKRIHWPSSAHRGRFMVKEFEQDPQADIWLFIDAQKNIHISKPENAVAFSEDGWWLRRPNVALPCDTFEYAISCAASLARYFLADRRAIGLACAAGKTTIVPAERGERQVIKIMETLAFLQPDGKMPLLGLVTMRAKLLPIGTGVIIITPSAQPEVLLAVEDLQRRNLKPMMVLIKTETFNGKGEIEAIMEGFTRRNIPVCSIGFGDNLSEKLSLPVVYFERSFPQRSFLEIVK